MTQHLYCGKDIPAASILPKRLSLLQSPVFEDGNPVAARKLFEEGIAELGITRESYPQLMLVTNPCFVSLAEVISQQINKALGISVLIKTYETRTYYQRLETADHDLAILGWLTWFQDPIYNLESYKFRNNRMTYTSWQNDRYIQLLDASDSVQDEEKRMQFLADAETLLMEELPTIPLFHVVDKYARAPDVLGEAFSYIDVPEVKGLEKQIRP